jgi:2-oxoglutarate ferredoxin oxidoreductase subunit delta
MLSLSTGVFSPAAETTGRRKGPRGKVVVFGMWCKECGICVEFCPTGVFAFDDHDQLAVARPENCTACHWCDTHCPDMAIVIKPIE